MNQKKLFNNSYSLGSWIQIGDPEFTKLMAMSGFDFLVMDMEHGSISESDLVPLLKAFEGFDCVPLVRVAKNDNILIRRALDLGAKGIVIPGVQSGQDIIKAKKALFYPPKGIRGIGYSNANMYGVQFQDYFKRSNNDVIFIAQIEHQKAVENIDAIFSQSDIDAYIIGPYDLSGSMGIIGEFNHPDFLNALEKIKKSAKKHHIPSGLHIVDPDIKQLQKAIDNGYKFIAYGTDALLLYTKCENDLTKIKLGRK